MMMENPRVIKTSQEHTLSYKNNSYQQQQKPNIRVLDEDTEISIFDAKRYFNESTNDSRLCKRVSPLNIPNPVQVRFESEADRVSSASSGYGAYGRNFRIRSFHATPTPSSEASWNSQTGSLSRPTGAVAVSMTTATDDRRKVTGKIRWLWLRSCPCSSKKSVRVEHETTLSSLNQKLETNENRNRKEITLTSEENHESRPNLRQRVITTTTTTTTRVPLVISNGLGTGHGTSGFTFPILDKQQQQQQQQKKSNVDDYDDLPPESLEVFMPPGDMNKKLVSRVTIQDDDVASDTSSDLFEIETLSTTTQTHSQTTSYPMYNLRDSFDEALHTRSKAAAAACKGGSGFGGCSYSPMVTECYEPSIDWSVTTAEGFERASVGVSETEEDMHFNYNYNYNGNGYGYGPGKKRSESGGLPPRNPAKYMPPRRQAATTIKHVSNVN